MSLKLSCGCALPLRAAPERGLDCPGSNKRPTGRSARSIRPPAHRCHRVPSSHQRVSVQWNRLLLWWRGTRKMETSYFPGHYDWPCAVTDMLVVSSSSRLCIYWRNRGGDYTDDLVLQMADEVQQEQIAYQLKASHRCSRLDQQPPHNQGISPRILSYVIWRRTMWYKFAYLGFEIITAIVMNVAMFWDIALCSPYVNRRFGGT
jgi:hypothetical protein